MVQRCGISVIILLSLIVVTPYGAVSLFLWSFLAVLNSLCLVAMFLKSDLIAKITRFARKPMVIVASVISLFWIVSVVAYVRVPYTQGKAWSIGGGNVMHEEITGVRRLTLVPTARLAWAGILAGGFGFSSGQWKDGGGSLTQYWAVWPLAVALVVPTMFCWWHGGSHMFQSSNCSRCGYSLHGLTAPRCPECGRPFERKDVPELREQERANEA